MQTNQNIAADKNPATSPDTINQASGHDQIDAVNGSSTLSGFSLWQKVVKRFLDVTLSLFTLIITAPLSLIITLLIKMSDFGPVLYRQERIGLKGKPFFLLKFRTMIDGAEPDGPQLSGTADPRVTWLGRFMRHHKIDEIPNFINVLKGEMSIVGPRPERQFYIDKLRARNRKTDMLFTMKPGITCYGQVIYGYASDIDSMAERLKHELSYISEPSLRADFKIMGQTILLLVRGRKNITTSL